MLYSIYVYTIYKYYISSNRSTAFPLCRSWRVSFERQINGEKCAQHWILQLHKILITQEPLKSFWADSHTKKGPGLYGDFNSIWITIKHANFIAPTEFLFLVFFPRHILLKYSPIFQVYFYVFVSQATDRPTYPLHASGQMKLRPKMVG